MNWLLTIGGIVGLLLLLVPSRVWEEVFGVLAELLGVGSRNKSAGR